MDYPWKRARPYRNLLEVIWDDYGLEGPLLEEVVSLAEPLPERPGDSRPLPRVPEKPEKSTEDKPRA